MKKLDFGINDICEVRAAPTGEVLRYIMLEGGKRYELLDNILLKQFIPKYGDLNEAAQKKALKKLLGGVKPHKKTLDLNLPPFGGKTLAKLEKLEELKDLSDSANAFLGLLEFFVNPLAGAALSSQILLSYHASELLAAFQDAPLLSFRGVPDELLECLMEVFRVVAPHRSISTHGLKLVREPIADLRGDGLTQPAPLDLSWMRLKHKRGTKTPAPLINTPVLLACASGSNPKRLADSLRNAAVTTVNSPGKLRNGVCLSFTRQDLQGFDRQVIDTFRKHKKGIRCILLLWWARGKLEFSQLGQSRSDRYQRFAEVRSDQLPQLYEDVLHAFIKFLADKAIITEDDAKHYHEQVIRLFHPQPAEEAAMTPPAFDDPDIFRAVIGDILAQCGNRIMGRNEERRPGTRPIGGWQEVSGELLLLFLEEEVKRLYPKYAKARGVPEADFQDPKWVLSLQKSMGAAGLVKLSSKGYAYHYDLVGHGRDNTAVLAVRADRAGLTCEETPGDAMKSVPGISPGFSPSEKLDKSTENR